MFNSIVSALAKPWQVYVADGTLWQVWTMHYPGKTLLRCFVHHFFCFFLIRRMECIAPVLLHCVC